MKNKSVKILATLFVWAVRVLVINVASVAAITIAYLAYKDWPKPLYAALGVAGIGTLFILFVTAYEWCKQRMD